MPARSTMLTGQYVRTHGVVANGVPLPDDAPSVAAYLREHGRLPHRAARQGALRAGLRPASCSGPRTAWRSEGSTGPYRGFEHAELAVHVPAFGERPLQHYGRWLIDTTASRRRRASRRCSRPSPAATPARPRRASTRSRASGTTPTGSPIARSRTSTRCPTTPTGSCGCRSPTRTTRGIRPRRSSIAATGATSTCRPVIPARNEKIERVLAQKPAHWLAYVGRHVRQRRRRTGHVPAAERQRRQHPRDQRDGAHHERAHRRGVRPRAAARRRSAAGTPTPTCSSRPTTASCRATTASSSRARSTPTR